jgi:glycosyltransferase involved in cell wall biosynthesis
LKIALVSLQFEATVTAGGGVHVEKVTEHLLRMGHHVTVLSIHTDKTLAGIALTEGPVCYSQEPRDGLGVVRLLIERGLTQPYGGGREKELARIKKFCDAVAWWLDQRRSDFEVVHLHGHHLIPGYLAWRLRDKGFKVVSTIHFLESTLLTADPEAIEHFRVTEETLTQIKHWEAMVRYADTIVSVSPKGKEDLFSLMSELNIELEEIQPKTHIVSSGVDKEVMMTLSQVEEKLAHVPDPVEIVTFARLDPSKGVHYGVRATAEAAQASGRQLRLTLAGIPASQSYLRRLEEESNRVRNTLPVEIKTFDRVFTPAERNALLDRFDIYLLPTLNEPFGMTIIEAGARGNIIITTDTAGPLYMLDGEGMKDEGWGYVTKCGICAKKTKEPEVSLASNLAKAIAWTLKHWEETSEHALKFLTKIGDRFTWRQVGQQYLELYRLPAAGKGPGLN